MAFIDWDDDMSVGVEELDEQHKEMLRLIDELHIACVKDQNVEAVARTAKAFIEHVRAHLATEERYMKLHDAPNSDEHLAKHRECRLTILDFFDNRLAEADIPLGREMLLFFRDWLLRHFHGFDRELGEFLCRKEKPE